MRTYISQTVAFLALAGGSLAGSGALSQAAGPSCTGNTVTVERGDTLSRIAERCNVSEGVILFSNPNVDGSSDLRVGRSLTLRRDDDARGGLESKLNDFAREANDAIGRVAGRVGSSVQDLLDKNPDLRSRLESVGRKVGIGDGTAAPTAAVSPSSGPAGSTVTVSATGLPSGTSISIGLGNPGTATEIVQEARSSSSGTLTANVAVPTWAAGSALVFTVRAGDEVKATTGRFQVTP